MCLPQFNEILVADILRYKQSPRDISQWMFFMHRAPVKQFLVFSMFYAVFAAVATCFVHPQGARFMMAMVDISEGHFTNLWKYMPLVCIGVLVAGFITRALLDAQKLIDAGIALLGCLLFMWGFSMFKSTMPHIIPFWADPMLASLDRTLHFGNDPWTLIDGLRLPLGTQIVDYIYLKFWAWPGVMGPILLVLFDNNPERLRRYLMLFLFTWIFLGNILAMLFMSAGPVFYDRMLGTDEFAALTAVLQTEAERTSIMGIMREWLWAVNQSGFEGVSSGISAFPSLHVAIAALACVYLCERSRYLIPVGVGFLGFIMLGSVLSGLHYAVDGYVSVAVVIAAWAVSRRIWPERLKACSEGSNGDPKRDIDVQTA